MRRTLLYHKGTDHSPGTYITNYLITVSCFIGAFIVFYFRKPHIFNSKPRASCTCTVSALLSISHGIIVLYIFMGLAMFLAALVHQFLPYDYHYPDAPLLFHIIWRAVLLCLTISAINLIFISYAIYHYNINATSAPRADIDTINICRTNHRTVVILCVAVLMVTNFIFLKDPLEIIAGVLDAIACVLLIIICTIKLCKDENISKCSLSLFITSAIIRIFAKILFLIFRNLGCAQLVIAPECPLAETCNHNCCYHIIECIGLMFLIPSVLALNPANYKQNEEDQATATQK